jgi:hypothetical protein
VNQAAARTAAKFTMSERCLATACDTSDIGTNEIAANGVFVRGHHHNRGDAPIGQVMDGRYAEGV